MADQKASAGLTGRGVTVAVLDTGIDASHPDFADRIADARSFVDGVPDPDDDLGHGTHVASILAGSGAAEGGRYRGIAPDARLLSGKVCDASGECPESAILAGMEWAAQSGAAVVNLSLGGPDTPEIDPLEAAINALTARHGTLFVASAGNIGGCGGPLAEQVGSPGSADAALAVGAVTRDDVQTSFSCHGPRVGDNALKPDIAAPGLGIVAARAPGTPVGDFEPVGPFYTRLSGTSMSAPHVAGAAAILAQEHPDWRAAELKAALMGSAHATGASAFLEGAGRVDVGAAIEQDVPGDRFTDSPYVYSIKFVASEGGMPDGFERVVDPAELATIENEYAESSPELDGIATDFAFATTVPDFDAFGVSTPLRLPSRRTAYHVAEGNLWDLAFSEIADDPFAISENFFFADLIALRPGQTAHHRWNQAVIGPSLQFELPDVFVARLGDEIAVLGLSLYSDEANHVAVSFHDTGSARLFRDGSLVGETSSASFAFFPVPPEAGEYRLELDSIRGGLARLSTGVNLAWTFRSQTDPENELVALPVLAVRFSPRLDDRNTAPPGGLLAVPFSVSRQAAAPAAPLTDLRVEASFDRGATWRAAQVTRSGDEGVALVRRPSRGGDAVSLRVTARDGDGNTAEQTILDAYHLAGGTAAAGARPSAAARAGVSPTRSGERSRAIR